MRVFRVEHETKTDPVQGFYRGPYRGDGDDKHLIDLAETMSNAHFMDESRPTPMTEGVRIESHEQCAFLTKLEAKIWFTGWIADLVQKGFVLAEYDVPSECVKIADKQVIFSRPEATQVAVHPL